MLERLVAATSVTAIRGAPAAALSGRGVTGSRQPVPTRIPPGVPTSQGPGSSSLEDLRSLSSPRGQDSEKQNEGFVPGFKSGHAMTHCSHWRGRKQSPLSTWTICSVHRTTSWSCAMVLSEGPGVGVGSRTNASHRWNGG